MGIEQYLQQILTARYGKDVRQSIHDSIYEINEVAKKAEYDASTAPESAKAYAQAALASEQAAEDYKTAAEQAAEQAMSGTPEGYADLVAKVNSIYRQTATSYNIVGTSEGSALAHTIYGMSVQDGTPTPSVPVDIVSAEANFKCRGKNLLNSVFTQSTSINGVSITVNPDKSFTLNGTASTNTFINLTTGQTPAEDNWAKLDKGKYMMTGQPTGTLWLSLQINSTTGTVFHSGDEIEITNDDTPYKIYLYIPSGSTFNNVVYKPMLTLDLDATYDDYEPYKETKVTTDLTLRAIEVTSSDDYTYERDGKYYIADTIDWSEDRGYQITRRIKREVFDGSEDEVINLWNNTTGSTQRRFAIKLLSFPKFITNAIGIVERWQGIANYLQKAPSRSSMNYEFGYYAFQCITPDSDYRFSVYDYMTSPRFSSVTEIKTWLASNNLVVDYVLATPTTESITSEQAQALLSLKTYDEATSISATGDIEPSVDLEYSKDRNTALALTGHNLAHKNALKLNDINTVLIELGGN